MENPVVKDKKSPCQLCQLKLSPDAVYSKLKSVVQNRQTSQTRHILARHLNFSIANRTDSATLIHDLFEQADGIDQMQGPIIEILELLVQYGADVNAKNSREHTVLHLAVIHRLGFVIEFLIDRGANLHVHSATANSILHFLIEIEYQKFQIISDKYKDCGKYMQQLETQCVDFIRWMISKGLDVDCKNENGDTVLHLAAKRKLLHALPLLLEHTKKADIFNLRSMTALQVFAQTVSSLDKESEKRVNEIYKKFLSKGFSVDVTDNHNCTPVHHALNQGRLSIVKLMLKNFTYTNVRDENQDTVLHIILNHLTKSLPKSDVILYYELARTLMTKGANIHQKNNDGISPLIAVVLNLQLPMLEIFAMYETNLHDTYKGKTLLHWFCTSILEKDLGEYKKLLILLKDNEDRTLLHYAARCSSKLANKLISYGADIHGQSVSGITPLHEAVENGRKDTIMLLTDKGVDVNVKDNSGKVPLHFAVESEIIEVLVQLGAKVNVRDTVSGYTPLHEAIKRKRDKSAMTLIEKGADVNAKDEKGKTPLHLAAQYGEPELVERLINCGTSVNVKERVHGYTPLHIAVECSREKSMLLLIANGAGVNARTKINRTPLHLVTYKNESAIKTLIGFGAHVDVADDYGCLPLHMAIINENWVGVLELFARGADINDNVDFLQLEHYKPEMIGNHMIKLKTAEMHVEPKLECVVSHGVNLTETRENCLKEIEILKSCKMSGGKSFYDLLHADPKITLAYVDYSELKKLISSMTFDIRFPMYHVLISSVYYRGLERQKMLGPAKDALQKFENTQLPQLCLHEIFRYLNNVSLRSLIEAAKDK